MDTTSRLSLPLIAAGQAQKHITMNEALLSLDALAHLAVERADLTAPPAMPGEGAQYIVGLPGEGDWAGRDHQVAIWRDGGWRFQAPTSGMLAWTKEDTALLVYDAAAWRPYQAAVNPIGLIGVNAIADEMNRLTAKTDAVLFSHDDITPGSGDIRHTLNKSSAEQTASVIFQDNWSGRAEIGLAGDDDLRMKVSADGAVWNNALRLDRSTGTASFPAGLRHEATGARMGATVQVNGGIGVTSIWRFTAARTGLPRYATIASVSGDTITLTQARANEFFNNDAMQGVSLVRVWNTTKSPEQSAWLTGGAATTSTASSELVVTSASDISGWQTGDEIRLGEPVGGIVASPNTAAVDVSPMMQAVLGASFPQEGLFVVMTAQTNGVSSGSNGQVSVSPDAAAGSFGSAYTPTDGSLTQNATLCGSNTASPVSDARLLYIRERDDGSGALRICAVSVNGILV